MFLIRNDANYIASLQSIVDPVLRQAWIPGSWDILAGQFFQNWDPARHVRSFSQCVFEPWQPRWISIDWGFEHATVVLWWTRVRIKTVLGVFLLLAVKQPVRHRSLIAYGAWSSLAHGFTMSIQSAEAAAHGIHRKDSPWDTAIFGVIGVALLALLPTKQPSPAPIRRLRPFSANKITGKAITPVTKVAWDSGRGFPCIPSWCCYGLDR